MSLDTVRSVFVDRHANIECLDFPSVVVCGGGCMGANVIFSLTRHPLWRKDVDTVTLLASSDLSLAKMRLTWMLAGSYRDSSWW